jgi:hypothetical protein
VIHTFDVRDAGGVVYHVRDRIDWPTLGRVAVEIRSPGDVWVKVAPLVRAYRRRLAKDRAQNAPTCPCCDRPHAKCAGARPCIAQCGRLTTPYESSACGYCGPCAADPSWQSVTA